MNRPAASPRPTCPAWTSGGSPGSTATTSGCTTGWARSSACITPCPGPIASWHRPPVPPVTRPSPAERGQRELRQPDGLGAAELLRPARGAAGDRYAWGKQNWLPWSAAEQRATRHAVAVFDQTSFSKFLLAGRMRRRRCSGCARPTSRCRPAGRSTPGCSTHAVPMRRTLPPPGCRKPSSCWSAARRRPSTTRTTSAAGSRQARPPPCSTSPPPARSTQSWGRGPGTCFPRYRAPTSAMKSSLSAPARSWTLATPPSGQPGLPT